MIDIFEIIFYHVELSNNCIAACCGSGNENLLRVYSIKNRFYDLEKKFQGHTDWVWKVIEMKDNKLISCSKDKTIKIWDMDNFDVICSYKASINISNNLDKKPKNMILVNENELLPILMKINSLNFLILQMILKL